MADNKDKKVLKSSIERELSQTCLNSAEREKIKGSRNLNVPHLRFPEFSGEWEKHTIGELAIKVGSGVTPKGGETVYQKEGHPFVRSQNVGLGVLLLEDIAYIDDTTHIRQKNTELQIDDVLLNITGASIGRCAVVNEQIAGGNVNQHVCIIRTKDNLVSPFLCNFLLSNYGQKQIDSFQAGGNRQGLNFEQIKSIKIGIPCLKEQSKIAKTLQLLDERIATQNKIIEKLESLIKGIYDKILWQGYKQTSLSEIFDERNERTTINNQYQVLSSTAKGLYRQSDYFDKEVASVNNIGYKVLRLGDIVLSPQNLWLGNINYNDAFEIGIVSPSYKVFSIREDYNPYFVSCFLKTPKALYEYANASEQGASIVRRNLDINAFMAICFPMPDRIMQDKVSERLRAINMKFDIEKQILEKLNIEKQYLLRQMFI